MKPELVFIHGMFMNSKSWADWIAFFEQKGFVCHAPAWPLLAGEPADLRAAPPEGLATLSLEQLMEHHRDFLTRLAPRLVKPVLIGHSVGGLMVQKLLNEDWAMAGIGLDSAPPQGVFLPSWSFLKANLPVLNPLAGESIFQFSLEQFHYAFCNTMPLDDTRAVYESLVVPASRKVARGLAGPEAFVDFAKAHPPLLLIGAEDDTIVPWRLCHKNYKAYQHPASQRTFKLFRGRGHFLCGQPGWEEIANFVFQWLDPMVD